MNPLHQKRLQILQQMERIQRMERGSLQAESRPSKRHCDCDCGPYYKHQVWEEGRNRTRRVPQDQAQDLAQAIEGRQQFEELARQFIGATVAMTREESGAGSKKKNSKFKPPSRKKRSDTSNVS